MNKTCEREISAKNRIRNDILLISLLLVIILVVAFCLLFWQKEGTTVEVTVNGVPYGTYSLDENRVVLIATEAGANRLVIENGKAFVEAASCPDGICVAHRPISGTRESIICLPHGVVISIRGTDDVDAPDLVV